METSILHLFAVFMALAHSVSPAAIPGFHDCVFNDRRYAIGQHFHPIVDFMGGEYEEVCWNCVCQPTTIAQCEEVQCPPTDCDDPVRLGGRCCPVCLQPDISLGDGFQPCVFEGLRFPHGDVFHPPSMVEAYERDTNSSVPNPFCIECTCNDSSVQCKDVFSECPPLDCAESEAVTTDGSCCPSCPSAPPEPRGGCLDTIDGRYFEEGESWNPAYPGLGLVECINCTCINSQMKCMQIADFMCPDVPPCGPDDPVESIVLCCPKCRPVPLSTPPPTTTNSSRVPTTYVPPVINPESDADLPTDDVSPDLTPCKNEYTIKVWKHVQDDAMAIENTEQGRVEIYSWIQTVDGLEREYSEVTSIEFNTDNLYEEYFFVGWTIQRRVNGLTGKPSKRQRIEMCTERCSQLVVNMLRPVTDNFSCNKK